jgi:hypothetical protein
MSNEKRIILLVGAIIVAALWVRVFAVSAYSPSEPIEVADDPQLVDPEAIYLERAQAALQESKNSSKICTSGNGSPVSCSQIDQDTLCISLRAGAQSGTRIDCVTDQPIPSDEHDASGAGGAKYRSPY